MRLIVISLKDIITTTKRMDKELLHGKVEISILEIIPMTKEMDMVKCIGQMAQCTRENGKKEFNMEKVK